jgi:putative transposase
MAIEKEVLDQLLAGRDPQELFGKDGLVEELKKALSQRILNTELDEHLVEERSEGNVNRRNGRSQKTVLTGTSKMRLSIPRDRAGTFDPKLIARYQRRVPDFGDKIVSMYARGMSVREIRGLLEELYGIDVLASATATSFGGLRLSMSSLGLAMTCCARRRSVFPIGRFRAMGFS